MTETEKQDANALSENWDTMRPVIAAVQAQTGLNRTEALLLWIITTIEGDEPEPWEQTA